jgi:hypothetical protein
MSNKRYVIVGFLRFTAYHYRIRFAEQEMTTLQEDIEVLKAEPLSTLDLYIGACHILFFAHGVMPTSAKLYQLIGKGSMTTVTEAVKRFWAQVRDKGRIVLEDRGLPAELQSFAGSVMGELWKRALDAADLQLKNYRAEADSLVLRANQRVDMLQSECTALTEGLEQKRLELAEEHEARAHAENRVIALEGQRELYESNLLAAREQAAQAQEQLQAAQQAFSAEVAQVRDAAQETERFSLMEIDKARQQSQSLKRELDQWPKKLDQEAQRHVRIQGELQHAMSKLEGAYQAICEQRNRLQEDVRRAHGEGRKPRLKRLRG